MIRIHYLLIVSLLLHNAGMWEGFRNFLFRGNVVELATAVIIGGAFTKIVEAFTKAIIEPLLKLLLGSNDPTKSLESLYIGVFPIGTLLGAIVNFIIMAAIVYFFLVKPLGSLSARFAAQAAPDPKLVALQEIRDLLKAQQEAQTKV